MSILNGQFYHREWQTALPIVKIMYLQPVRGLTYIKLYVYMDDIILGAPTAEQLTEAYKILRKCLSKGRLHISSDKVQLVPPFKILGSQLSLEGLSP